MHKHVLLKFFAVLFCAVFLLTAAVSGFAIVFLGIEELYTQSPEEMYALNLDGRFYEQAYDLGRRYTIDTNSNLTETELDWYYGREYIRIDMPDESLWYYRIYDMAGNLLEGRYNAQAVTEAVKLSHTVVRPAYPMVLDRAVGEPDIPDTVGPTQATFPDTVQSSVTAPEMTVPTTESQGDYYFKDYFYFWDEEGRQQRYLLGFCEGEDLLVELYLLPGAYEVPDHWGWELLEFAYSLRYELFWVLGGSLLLFALLLVYLCCVAGRKPKSDGVCPGGLNRIPLDLYLGGGIFAAVVLVVLISDTFYWPAGSFEPMWLIFAGIGALGYVFCLLAVGFLFACAAQMKVKGGWWLKHTAIGFLLILVWKCLKWLVRLLDKGMTRFAKVLPKLAKKTWVLVKTFAQGIWKLIRWAWETFRKLVLWLLALVKKCAVLLWKGTCRFVELLPHTWQWLMGAVLLVFFVVIAIFGNKLFTLVAMGGGLALVLYSAHCFGTLLEGTKRMSGGNLETKVDDKALMGSFREYANHLNALAGVATEAAKQQMKSERMKAELVTNVSHDIKTPLTSIINYVDLLQKAQSQEEAEAHLEVLQRQSQRLKKLIEDLMEMSKASTGNMAVELTAVDASEAINQALGEFSEKLQQANITPVFLPPETPVMLTADGRLTWRVLSNLLSNAVKYALPGTRLYIDLVKLDGKVLISLKNISREQLNVSSEELMERFVRGDASRNTEGSGLGLNIARSLMELQKGQLQLLVDGDLFKATLIFPECS